MYDFFLYDSSKKKKFDKKNYTFALSNESEREIEKFDEN